MRRVRDGFAIERMSNIFGIAVYNVISALKMEAEMILPAVPACWPLRNCMNAYESRCEKTGLRGFRPGPTQTRLYSYSRWLEA